MQEVATEGIIFFFIMLAGLGLSLINGVLWIVLHNVLYKKLDETLFVAPYFSQAELAMYSAWPLSLLKSMMYMFLITMPNYSRRKRFKGFSQELQVSALLEWACKICVSLLFLTALLGVAFFLYGGALYIADKAWN